MWIQCIIVILAISLSGLAQDSVSIVEAGPQLIEFGQTLNLTCSDLINANVYDWMVNGESVQTGSDPILTIPYTDPSDASNGGTYVCLATDDNNITVGSNISVFVAFAAVVTESPQSIQTSVNNMITLSCNVTGFPAPSIMWARLPSDINSSTILDDIEPYFNNLPDSVEIDFPVETNYSNSSTITIDLVDYEDFGYYMCVAFQSNDSIMMEMDEYDISDTATVTGNSFNCYDIECFR